MKEEPTNVTGSIVSTDAIKKPFIKKRKKKKKEIDEEGEMIDTPSPVITPDSTFAGMPVFDMSCDDKVSDCQFGKKKYSRWAKTVDIETDFGKKIYSYAKKNPTKNIIVKNTAGNMIYLKKYYSKV